MAPGSAGVPGLVSDDDNGVAFFEASTLFLWLRLLDILPSVEVIFDSGARDDPDLPEDALRGAEVDRGVVAIDGDATGAKSSARVANFSKRSIHATAAS